MKQKNSSGLKTSKKKRKFSETNDTTKKILNFLFGHGVFAWRNNTVGIPIRRDGSIIGFRPTGKTGVGDIIGVCPIGGRGVFLSIEVKTGKDKLSDVQLGFMETVNKLNGVAIVVKNYEDFIQQWSDICQK